MSQGHISEQEFREKMIDGIADLRAKMNMLVGLDGTNGWKSEVDKDIKELKSDRDTRSGSHRVLGFLSNFASGIVGAILTYLLKRH